MLTFFRDDNYTCTKVPEANPCHKHRCETDASVSEVFFPQMQLRHNSELSVMAVSVQRDYFYFRSSSPTSVRVWQRACSLQSPDATGERTREHRTRT